MKQGFGLCWCWCGKFVQRFKDERNWITNALKIKPHNLKQYVICGWYIISVKTLTWLNWVKLFTPLSRPTCRRPHTVSARTHRLLWIATDLFKLHPIAYKLFTFALFCVAKILVHFIPSQVFKKSRLTNTYNSKFPLIILELCQTRQFGPQGELVCCHVTFNYQAYQVDHCHLCLRYSSRWKPSCPPAPMY